MLAERRLWMAVRSMRARTSTATDSGMSSESASSTLVASTFAPAQPASSESLSLHLFMTKSGPLNRHGSFASKGIPHL
jgi:hypothetical protein